MLDNLSIFGFRALWSPFFLLFTILLGSLYLLITIGPLRKKFKDYEPVKGIQLFYFMSAVVILYIIKGSPADLLGHLNFTMHMTQMALLYLTVPPLMILGTPDWVLRKILSVKFIRKFVDFFTKPLIALLLFNGLFSFYHFPMIFDVVKVDPVLHALYTTVLFVGAMCMWWPLLCPLPEYQKLTGLQKMGYIFADGILLTPACALIIFAPNPMYATFTDPAIWAKSLELCVPASLLANIDLSQPQMFSWLPPVEDQQLGGVVMKILQEIMYGAILGYNFFKWVKEQKAQDEIDTAELLANVQHHPIK